MKRDYAASEIPLTRDVSAFFRSYMLQEIRRDPAVQYQAMMPIYAERMDEENMTLIMPPCENMERAFHACISAAGQLLPTIHAKNFVYEGQADVIINPRGIIQNTARWYDVDPNDLARNWPNVRLYLSHKLVTLPETLEAGLLKQEQHGNAHVRKYH